MVQQAFDDLTNVWDVMLPVKQYKFINEVEEKITIHLDCVEMEYKTDGLEAVITESEDRKCAAVESRLYFRFTFDKKKWLNGLDFSPEWCILSRK